MNNPRDWTGSLGLIALQVVGLLLLGGVIGLVILLLFWR